MQSPEPLYLVLLTSIIIFTAIVLVILLHRYLSNVETSMGGPLTKESELSDHPDFRSLPETQDFDKLFTRINADKGKIAEDLKKSEYQEALSRAKELLQVLDDKEDAEAILGSEKYNAINDELNHMILSAECNMRVQDIKAASSKMQGIGHKEVEKWNAKDEEKNLDELLHKCYSLSDQVREMLAKVGDAALSDDLETILELIRIRVLEAREDIRKRTQAEREYYQLIAFLNQAILQIKTGAKRGEDAKSILERALKDVVSYRTNQYFSGELIQRADRAVKEARELLTTLN